MDSRTSSLKQSTKTPGIRWLSKNYGPNDVLSEGYLTKIGQRWKSHKRRWFVITFQDIRYYENRDKYEANAAPLGSINVSEIQSIQQSNALGFGANTSLSICTAKRTLEVGDQKELVADGLLFVLQRWIGIRLARSDPSQPPSLTIPVIEMPNALQREAFRYIEELPTKNYPDLMQEPPFLYSYTPETRAQLREHYSSLFPSIFGTDPSQTEELLNTYILLHGVWTHEIVLVKTASGTIRRICLDPEPLLNFLSDNFGSVSKMDLTCFDEIHQIPSIALKLKALYEDYKFCLPQLILPTFLSDRDQVIDVINLFEQGMPGIQFQTPTATTSCKVLMEDGTYLLHLYANPPETAPAKIISALENFAAAISSSPSSSNALSQTPERSTVESPEGMKPLGDPSIKVSSSSLQNMNIDPEDSPSDTSSPTNDSIHPAEAHPPTIHLDSITMQQQLASDKPGDPVIHLI